MHACLCVCVCEVTSTIARFRVTRPPSLVSPVFQSVFFFAGSRSLAVCSLNSVDLSANPMPLLSLTLHERRACVRCVCLRERPAFVCSPVSVDCYLFNLIYCSLKEQRAGYIYRDVTHRLVFCKMGSGAQKTYNCAKSVFLRFSSDAAKCKLCHPHRNSIVHPDVQNAHNQVYLDKHPNHVNQQRTCIWIIFGMSMTALCRPQKVKP